MTDFEDRLSRMMQERSTDVDPAAVPTNQIVRRARRRRGITLSVAVAGLVGLVFSGVALSSLATDGPSETVNVPAGPTPYSGHPGPFDTTDDPGTKRIEVARGEHRGLPWTYYLYKDPDWPDHPGPKGAWCDSFEWDGGGGGCPVTLGKKVYASQGRQGGDGSSEDVVTGSLDESVARVVIRLDAYEPFEVPVIPGPHIEPPEEDPGVNFFVAFVPADATGEIVVYDAEGNELQSMALIDFGGFSDIGPEEEDGPLTLDRDERCIAEAITIRGTEGADTLRGTQDADTIAGLGGDDTILGLGGNDMLCGGDGNDSLDGGPGGDELAGGLGDDEMDGGEGFDTLAFWDSTTGVDIDAQAGVASGQGADRIALFEQLWGTDYSDRIAGGEGPEQIDGGDGEDFLDGRGGDDILFGGPGDDSYVGGEGQDIVPFSSADHAVEVDLAAQTAIGEGNDTIVEVERIDGTRFADVITGGPADDLLIGREGNDTLAGGEADDVLWGEFGSMTWLRYRSGTTLIEGLDDSLDGGPGHDELHGGPGHNVCTEGEELEDC